MNRMRVRIGPIVAFAAGLLLLVACFKDDNFTSDLSGGGSGTQQVAARKSYVQNRRVMIMVSAGYNSLSSYLHEDLVELSKSALPVGTGQDTHVLMVLSRLPVRPDGQGNFATSAPVLYRMYRDEAGTCVRDTLLRWEEDTPLCQPEVFREALEFVYRRFPARGYGMVFSSHASGWMPDGYYNNPDAYEASHKQPAKLSIRPRAWDMGAVPFPVFDPSEPMVKSLGQDVNDEASYEMELDAFAAALPIHLDYLLLDACLNGCVEVAHAFRDKADIVGFSPTEVLANGFDYDSITSRLLQSEPDPVAVCQDYFAFYEKQSGINQSATICVVDTRKMDALEDVCFNLFGRYREEMETMDASQVQGYFRYERHYFYDLKDILVKAGITDEEQEQLDEALDACILYKAATPWFFQDGRYGFPIRTYCGMSMYLPSMGTPLLDSFYQQHVSWNQATHLVE